MLEICSITGCKQSVSKPGHTLCYEHWKANKLKVNKVINFPPVAKVTSPPPLSADVLLSATKISERLGLSKKAINPILAELGLLDKVQNGWFATRLGLSFGAVQKYDEQKNNSYVLWSEEILNNQIFIDTFRRVSAQDTEPNASDDKNKLEFREKFHAGNYRTTDGHWVRSKAELAIDNWLYMAGLVHAYERKLPIEEEVYCDFYMPSGRVYIEYWGYEDNPEYLYRKREKQHIYQKYEFNLIELTDEHIKNLDDHLPTMLRGFGIVVN
ncbi:MAG TPA: hypothetical protein IGS40_28575 [Trichormus sp. M33_DOE_039]|nr:hypothetical protein [Trichormus sp. M33_DOE_039]